ncbi:MAG: type II toxin-antitoxin system Phd/YefM family antitoxin [Rhizobacter sp.]|nr:type II toxin-antitoxin system Phd/YefM family antitoxin [Ferruginibacter sp.]
MKVVNYTEFRNNLAENLNVVNDDGDVVIVSGRKGKNVVVISLDEYNSMKETLYLSNTKANRKQLDAAIGKFHYDK